MCPPKLKITAGGQTIKLLDLERRRDGHPQSPGRKHGAFAADLPKVVGQARVVAERLDLDEPAVGAAFLLEVRMVNDPAFLQNKHLVAGFFDVT